MDSIQPGQKLGHQLGHQLDLHRLADDIRSWGAELGFQQVGITDTSIEAHGVYLKRWLAREHHGTMGYMARNVDKRIDPGALAEDTIRIISARMDYLPEAAPAERLKHTQYGYISRYALGRDYHKTVRRRLAKLATRINDAVSNVSAAVTDASDGVSASDAVANTSRFRAFTDTAPVLEKALAEKAGLGWIGKNTLLLSAEAGSFFFLGEIFTNIPLPVDAHEVVDQCGACRACINVCPTGAIVGPRQLDARRCISYLTIESKDGIPLELREAVGNRIFGCDDCQLICPWNRYARISAEPDFVPRHGLDEPALTDLLGWDEQQFLSKTEGSAIRRIDYRQWLRNLSVAAGNAPFDPKLVEALKIRKADVQDPMVREHIDWALERQTSKKRSR
ncbi:MAG: tRNA epoxyqueuosine(34) reductase QueG [Gammaproteobacteria bacterium]|nr:tRNA epoxyqueuosine(34) reductase QueG [Gammaproteobacteria bacterium]